MSWGLSDLTVCKKRKRWGTRPKDDRNRMPGFARKEQHSGSKSRSRPLRGDASKPLHLVVVEEVVLLAAGAIGALQAADEEHGYAHRHEDGQNASVDSKPVHQSIHAHSTSRSNHQNRALPLVIASRGPCMSLTHCPAVGLTIGKLGDYFYCIREKKGRK